MLLSGAGGSWRIVGDIMGTEFKTRKFLDLNIKDVKLPQTNNSITNTLTLLVKSLL